MKNLFLVVFVTISVVAVTQESMSINEKDGAKSSFSLDQVMRIESDSSSTNVFFGQSYDQQFVTNNIQNVIFNLDSVKGCMDPKAYNYDPVALIVDSCKYQTLNVYDTTKTAIDTVGTNPQDVCTIVDIRQAVDYARILSYFLVGNTCRVTWQIAQNGNVISVEAFYNVPYSNFNRPTLFVLNLKCKGSSGSRTAANEATYQSFADVITEEDVTALDEEEHIVESNVINAYPNPNTGHLTVSYSISKNATIQKVDIASLKGSVIRSIPLTDTTGNGSLELFIDDLAPGNYILRVFTEGDVLTQKIFKL